MKAHKVLSIWLTSAILVWQMPLVAIAQEVEPAAAETTTETIDSSSPQSQNTSSGSGPTSEGQEPSVSTSTPTPVATPENLSDSQPKSSPGPSSPTGADGSQYVYNSQTGLWESERYTWDPSTGQSAPRSDPGYYYNSDTGTWDTNEYVFHPESGRYEPSVSDQPHHSVSGGIAEREDGQALAETLDSLFAPLLALGNTHTGPNSSNSIEATGSNKGFFDLFSRANVTNNINSGAFTGDALVSGNTSGGSALTGAANVVANILNLLNSAWSWAGGALNFMAQNFFDDHYGDINLDPGSAPRQDGGGSIGSYSGFRSGNSNTGPESTNEINAASDNQLTVINRPSGSIANDIDLLARSGDAGVIENTNGGSATSGDASAVLNLLNFINSSIASGQSFFGMLNFFGSLNGDVLFPEGFLTNALQGVGLEPGTTSVGNSNTGPQSSNTIDASDQNNVNITNSPQANFDNNIDLAAQSGHANIQGNTIAGSALTGNATTDNNLFNLYNSTLLGQNAVLVLVNVGGTWTGQIMNIPAGSNPGTASALLTSNATIQNNDTGPGSTNAVNFDNNNNLTVVNQPAGSIANNVRVGAMSGDATVRDNTSAGNAATGDARAVSNVANMFNSHLNLAGWFGVLVINVFEDWNGSVNKDTEAGESAPSASRPLDSRADRNIGVGGQAASQSVGSPGYGTHGGNSSGGADRVGGLVDRIARAGGGSSQIASLVEDTKVLGAREVVDKVTQEAMAQAKSASLYLTLGALFILLGGMLFGLERYMRKIG